jgi:hypothetical protein
MKYRSFVFLFSFVALILMVGVACLDTTPTPQPQQPPSTQAPATQAPATQPPSNSGNTTSSDQLTTFTDKNKYYQIDVPADWKYEQTVDKTNHYYYIDSFTSSDGNAVIESIVYDDGTAFRGSDESKFGLYLLNTFYSKTGKEGDIKVTEEKVQSDGSDRLTWYSKAGDYSGISFLEIRNRTTFLMFTIDWGNAAKDTYFDTLDKVVSSYRVP